MPKQAKQNSQLVFVILENHVEVPKRYSFSHCHRVGFQAVERPRELESDFMPVFGHCNSSNMLPLIRLP